MCNYHSVEKACGRSNEDFTDYVRARHLCVFTSCDSVTISAILVPMTIISSIENILSTGGGY